MKIKVIYIGLLILTIFRINAQDISLFQQFNGTYDYTAIGNTMNISENGSFATCEILTTSSADLQLLDNQNIIAAYLYWAGSGAGDFEILLNGIEVSASRTFSDALDDTRIFFAAFADVTTIVTSQMNGTYTVSEFDITNIINTYCNTGTNFGGWAMTVIYEDNSLPLNQVNVYDGLQSVPESLTVTLDNLNVLDNENAKIGFIAWEGDSTLAVNEQLNINGNLIGNPPLNPNNNAFNGTNSFTGQSDLYNMDIDVYNIQNNIAVGDTSATITLTSGQDFVMVNNIITVLNSQLPDATIVLNSIELECDSRSLEVNYTINNTNSSGILMQNTPIAFYANDMLIGQTETQTNIAIGGSESGVITLQIPENTPNSFTLNAVVDDDGTSNGIVIETNENNNETSESLSLLIIPPIVELPSISACNIGFEKGKFNLLLAIENNSVFENQSFQFYENLEDLRLETNSISEIEDFQNSIHPQTLFIRLEQNVCYEIFQFDLIIENCPPEIPEGFSPNNDSVNDWFNIRGLYNIFIEHELKIYNRLGTLIFIGNNEKRWSGIPNRGINKGNLVPVGTYYYILNLNDINHSVINGWVYVNY